jgi:hypothetical protein
MENSGHEWVFSPREWCTAPLKVCIIVSMAQVPSISLDSGFEKRDKKWREIKIHSLTSRYL